MSQSLGSKNDVQYYDNVAIIQRIEKLCENNAILGCPENFNNISSDLKGFFIKRNQKLKELIIGKYDSFIKRQNLEYGCFGECVEGVFGKIK